MMMRTCNPNLWEVKVGGLLQDQGQPGLHRERVPDYPGLRSETLSQNPKTWYRPTCKS